MGGFVEAKGDGADGAGLGGDVVAALAVAAGGGESQDAFFVAEGGGDAVDFGLEDVLGLLAVEIFLHALIEGAHFGFVVGVVDAHHRDGVLDGGETFDGLAADALGGGGWGIELGVGGFEFDQLLHELVELNVGDFGAALIVEIVMAIQIGAKLVDPLLWALRHGGILIGLAGWDR
jgi:hypothetical protein